MRLLAITVLTLSIPGVVLAEQSGDHPCEKETAALMEIKSPWSEMYRAAQIMPDRCFDGYFAEGISDTLVRKIGQDWPGFIALLRKEKDTGFIPLVLKSINETLNPNDVAKVKELAQRSCPRDVSSKCAALLKQIDGAFGEYFRGKTHGS